MFYAYYPVSNKSTPIIRVQVAEFGDTNVHTVSNKSTGWRIWSYNAAYMYSY